MTEQKSAPKKKKVGSLFFHLFNRMSLWLYTLLIKSMIARFLTSYDVLEQRWHEICTRIFGTPDKKFRQGINKVRLRCARLLEHSVILHVVDYMIKFLINCPLNAYGIFFFIYGAVSAAVYFVAEQLSVEFNGTIGWGITGIIIAVSALPLLGTGKSLSRAAFGSRILGKLLTNYLGFEPPLFAKEEKERSTTALIYFALILALAAGMLTFFFHPLTLPVLLLILILAVMVLYVPETGVLLAVGTIGFWWTTGLSMLCAFFIAVVTLVSYVNKLIRGKRVMHIRLLDFVILLLATVFAVHGLLARGGVLSVVYGIGYAVLIIMYFPTVNLMRSRKWLDRGYKLLAISGAVLAVLSVLPFQAIFKLLDMALVRVDLSMMSTLFSRYDAYFGQGTMIASMVILILPLMLSHLMNKQTLSALFWKVLWVLVACLSVLMTWQFGVLISFVVSLAVLLFVYSHRSLSAVILAVFPVTCGAVWYKEIDALLGLSNMQPVQSALNMAVVFADGAACRREMAGSVLRMSRDNLLGVGFGDAAVHQVLAYYTTPGLENADIQNTYLQLLAECGYLGLVMLLGVFLMFIICVMTYMRWGGNQTTKVRVAAGLAGVIGVLTVGLYSNLMDNASLFCLIWLVIGMTVASLRTQYETHARSVQTHAGNTELTDIAFRTK